jgi:hypothetical protein
MLRSLLRSITDFSFLFAFLSILFRDEVTTGLLLVIFMAGITVSFLGSLLRAKSRLWPVVMLVFVPLLTRSQNAETATLILVSGIVSLLFIANDRGSLDYFYQIKEFHLVIRGMVLYLAVTILLSGFRILEERVIQYVIVYVLNTSVLLRILRHDEYLAGNTRNRIYNMRLAAGSLLLSLVLSVERVREFLAMAAGVSYSFLADVFFRIIYTPLFLVYTVVDAFLTFIFSRFTPPQTVPQETDTSGVAGMYRNYNEGFEIIGTSPYLRFLPGIFLLLLIGYVLYRLFKRKRAFSYMEGAYSEEREIIEKKGKPGLFSRRDKDSVRGRYARYLQSLKRETPIRPSDTSRDVLSKIQKELVDSVSPGGVPAQEGENRSRTGETLDTHERIRNAYVKVRYGEEILTGEEEDAFKEAVDRVVKARETKAAGAKGNRKRHAR